MSDLSKKSNSEKFLWSAKLNGRFEKATLRGGMNSRPYGRQLLVIHRVGHLALPKRFFNSPLTIDSFGRLRFFWVRLKADTPVAEHSYGVFSPDISSKIP